MSSLSASEGLLAVAVLCTYVFIKLELYASLLFCLTLYLLLQNDTVTIRTRKFMTNRLLQRKQMVKEYIKLALIICLLVLGCKCSLATISKGPLKTPEFLL